MSLLLKSLLNYLDEYPVSIDLMLVGKDLGRYGTITSSINKDGIIMLETEYGSDIAVKILNLENKPSLYRGGLVY